MGNLGFSEIMMIAVIALVLFGPSKLPELGKSLGKSISEFKRGLHEVTEDDSKKSG